MRSLRALALLLLIAGAVIAAGCGTENGATTGSTSIDSAGVVPASAAVYLSLNTDPDSEQWQMAETLQSRFPAGGDFIREALSDLGSEGLDLEADVQPALGPELVIAALAATADEVDAVVLTQPRDEAQFNELTAQRADRLTVREINGWKALAETEDVLDRYEAALEEGSLASSEDFEAVAESLGGTGLATVFVPGANLLEAAKIEGGADETVEGIVQAIGTAGALGGQVSAEPEGFRLSGLARASGVPETSPYESQLVEIAPAETALIISFNDVDSILSELLDALGENDPDLDQQIGLLEAGLGISITDDVLPLFANEGAVLVLPGATESAVAIVLEVENVDQALETIDSVSNAIAALTPDAAPGTSTRVEGVEVRQLAIDGEISLSYAGFDGLLVFSTSPEVISMLRASGDKLVSDPRFGRALETTGMPDETNGFVYVNFDEAIPALEEFELADGLGSLPDGLDDLAALDWALLYGTREGDDLPFAGFLAVK